MTSEQREQEAALSTPTGNIESEVNNNMFLEQKFLQTGAALVGPAPYSP